MADAGAGKACAADGQATARGARGDEPHGRSRGGRLVGCHECDLLQTAPELGLRQAARCVRCEAVLLRNPVDSLERTLALAAAGALLYVLANLNPLVGIEMQGMRVEVTLFGAVQALWGDGMQVVAGLVFATVILFPVLELAMLIALLIQVRVGRRGRAFPLLFRLVRSLRPWGMIEVLLLGMLVSLVKLSHLSTVILGVAFWAIAALIVVLAAAAQSFNPALLWEARRSGAHA